MEKIKLVKEFRLSSKDKGARDLAKKPTIFRDINNPESFIVIPRTTSENRKYIPMGFFDKNYIVSDTMQSIPNATLYHFGVLESEMHMTWVRHVCGRLKSDFRYSKDIVYNNFPWPENPSEEKIKAVEKYAQEVLDVREKYMHCHPELDSGSHEIPDQARNDKGASLADLYDPLTMPADLVKAHQNLDRAVDRAYGKQTFKSEAERMEFLFGEYKEYIKNNL